MSIVQYSEIINHAENVSGRSIKSESVTINILIFIYVNILLRTKYECVRVITAARHGRKKRKNRDLLIITVALCQYVGIIAVSAYNNYCTTIVNT